MAQHILATNVPLFSIHIPRSALRPESMNNSTNMNSETDIVLVFVLLSQHHRNRVLDRATPQPPPYVLLLDDEIERIKKWLRCWALACSNLANRAPSHFASATASIKGLPACNSSSTVVAGGLIALLVPCLIIRFVPLVCFSMAQTRWCRVSRSCRHYLCRRI